MKLKSRGIGISKAVEEYLRYKKDIVKFVEDCVYVKDPCEGKKKIKLDYIQKKILKSFMKDHNLYLLCSRWVGTSTSLKFLITYIMTFCEDCSIGVISRNRRFVVDIQEMLDDLPPHIKQKYVIKCRDRIILKNGCDLLFTTNSNPNITFLGNTLNILIVEDAAYMKNMEELIIRLYPTLAMVQNLCKERNKQYGIIISSSPNAYDKKNYFQKIWTTAKKECSNFTPIEVYWRRITRLREDPTWYSNACRNLLHDKKKIARELNLKFI